MLALLARALLLSPAPQSQPLFAFVSTSDSQPKTAQDQAQFEAVLDRIDASGHAGALLPTRVSFVLFAGDLVNSSNTGEWNTFVDTVDSRLTANGIALLAVPGNHDQTGGSVTLYEQFIADSSPWDVSSAAFTGQNGIPVSTGWSGLRFIGLNNSNGAYNQVSTADQIDVQQRANAAVAREENVVLIVHHPHNADGRVPLLSTLETHGVIGYVRGHSGSPSTRHGLSGIANPDLFEFNTNSIFEDGALVYYEAFPTELHAYLLQLRTNPTRLPAALVVPLLHPLTHGASEPPNSVRLEPVADAEVNSAHPRNNYGLEPELRLRDDGTSSWRSYLRFDLSSLAGAVPVAARLRLFCTDSSPDGGALFAAAGAWSETALTADSAPAPSGAALVGARAVTAGTWYESDVTGAITAGVHEFALVSGNSNGAIYSSREGAHPPELLVDLVPSVPLSITSVVPSTVDVFEPGTAENVRVLGAGFGAGTTAGTTVELDGNALDAASFTVVDGATLTLDLPPASVGAHTLTVRRGTRSASSAIQVRPSATPLLQLGTGDPGNGIRGGQPLRIFVAGPIGSQQLVVMSTSLVPSSSRLATLLIGAGNTDLHFGSAVPIPAAGFAAFDLPLHPTISILVYAQSLSLGAGAPFPASNLQSVFMSP